MLEGRVVTGPPVAAPSRGALTLRLLLTLALLAAWAHASTVARERPLADLVDALGAGRVSAVVLGRPESGFGEGYGTYRVEWSGPGGNGYATYRYEVRPSGRVTDEGQQVLDAVAASPSRVKVELRPGYTHAVGFQWYYPGVVGLLALGLLIAGPQPRLATKWAWFWVISAVPLLWFAFLLLEPAPVWRRSPVERPRRRLTGGWAFLLSLFLDPVSVSGAG